ncbi:MAG: alpha-ketoglutarate-dependent dioxygenase AlkB [Aestuariivita sp.]|nr:alpha-ketoglutarate-dependent dioxygenase AlkB [Aestuariivita sp.]MCY4203106.1 alpha-ketoglutarate-dependent dioxygenase AlkB [Aestuariivita sp.]
MQLSARDFIVHKGYLNLAQQRNLVDELRSVVRRAPLFRPLTPYGKPMRVQMTSAGRYGWYSDHRGYRYIECHPSGGAWPNVPDTALAVWSKLVSEQRQPDCCLINFYDQDSRMGMHQDKDEADFSWPVLSISLGDEALFRMGNEKRGGSTESLWLHSGDIVIMAGAARLKYHGIDRIRSGSSGLLTKGGRINLTLRVVD